MHVGSALDRFLDAQAPVHAQALAELKAGKKASHWMWFIFPQIAGLGLSSMSQRYAITSIAEAQAYLAHPVLGPRLLACTAAVLEHRRKSAKQIFGHPDDLKFHSSVTLFHEAAPSAPLFSEALAVFFGGKKDIATLSLLAAPP